MSNKDVGVKGTLSADGQSATLVWPGGSGYFMAASGGGNGFGSGTATLQFSLDGSNWVGFEDAALTAGGGKKFEALNGVSIRLDLSGSTSPTLDYAFGKWEYDGSA